MKKTKILSLLAVSTLALLLSGPAAFAVPFSVGGLSASGTYNTYWESTSDDPAGSGLYKAEFKEGEIDDLKEEGATTSFHTAWGNLDDDDEPFKATITWTAGLNFSLTDIFMKAGQLKWYAFDVSGFDSSLYDSIELFHPGSRFAISHVKLIGELETPSVPDSASTLGLLGAALVLVGIVARRRKA